MDTQYTFLVLSLLFLVPGVLFVVLRLDLRRLFGLTALFSLPFAATEFLFYPSYWHPETLFDLVPRIGFGIEDILFVVGLGLVAVGVYPVLLGRRIIRVVEPSVRRSVLRATGLLFLAAAGTTGAAIAGVPMIYAAPAIMVLCSIVLCVARPDLRVPALFGGVATLVIYTALSLVYQWLFPSVFRLDWNTEAFLNMFVFGVPVEELIYGFAAGLIGSVFTPFVTGDRFV